jgi:tetratricopeptide (TPR) repeat protein
VTRKSKPASKPARLREFRSLLVVYGVAAVFALVEYYSVRGGSDRVDEPFVNRPEIMAQLAETYMQLYPDQSMAHYLRGTLAYKEQDHQRAREHYEQALRTNGSSENALYEYALNLVAQGEPESRIEAAVRQWQWHYPKSKRPDPRAALPQSPYDLILAAGKDAELGEFVSARVKYERAFALGDRSEALLYNYTLTLLLLGERQELIDRAAGDWRIAFPGSEREDPRVVFQRGIETRNE